MDTNSFELMVWDDVEIVPTGDVKREARRFKAENGEQKAEISWTTD